MLAIKSNFNSDIFACDKNLLTLGIVIKYWKEKVDIEKLIKKGKLVFGRDGFSPLKEGLILFLLWITNSSHNLSWL